MKRSKIKEIFFGIFTAVVLWIVGNLLAGRAVFPSEFFDAPALRVIFQAGYLVFAFPLVFMLWCLWISRYARKNRKRNLLRANLICLFVPLAFLALHSFLAISHIIYGIPDDANLLLLASGYPLLAEYVQVLQLMGQDPGVLKQLLYFAVFFIPMFSGLIISFINYRKISKK